VEHVDELIYGQALHALSSDEEEHVALHVAECERCRRQLREAEAVAASLAYAAPAVEPPPDLRARVLAAVEPVVEAAPATAPVPRRAPGRFAWWPRFAVVAVPALAAVVIGMLVWNVSLRGDLSSLHGQLSHGTAGNLSGVGNVVVNTNGQATLFASLRQAPAGKTYEAWVIQGKVALPAGIFQGGGTLKLTLTKPAKPGDVIAITVEPAGGTKAPTTTPIAAHKI
jgi:anti-sigma-K factor RskA